MADHITLSGFGGMWAGRSNNVTFENSEVIGNYAAFPNGQPGTGIFFGEGVSSSVIRGNIVRGVGNGIQATANPSAPISGITIEDNVYYDNSAHAMYIGRYVSNVIVSGNRAWNGYEGIYLAGVENAEVYNNTYYYGPVWVLVDSVYNRPCRNVRLRNNIILSGDNNPWTDDGYFIAVDAVSVADGYSSDYNLFYKAPSAPTAGWVQYDGVAYSFHAEYQSVSGQDLHTVVANPLFLNGAGHDFNLQMNSPAINAGDPGFGTNFPGAQIDIGAFEYTGEEPLENHPPIIAPVSNQIARVNKPFSLNISATDADNDRVYFDAPVRPAWLTLTDNADNTATLSGTPGRSDLGNHLVRIEATDDLSEPVAVEFEVAVKVRIVRPNLDLGRIINDGKR